MNAWTSEQILAASAAGVWVPDDAVTALTADYQLVNYPAKYGPGVQVAWSRSRSSRAAVEVVDEVAARVRGWGEPRVSWWVSDATRPRDTEAALLARGAVVEETVEVLALDLGPGLPRMDTPADVSVVTVADERAVRACHLVLDGIWGRPAPSQEQIIEEIAVRRQSLAERRAWVVLAVVDGQPAAAGGCSMVGDVAQLWGGATLPALRGRGAYRAVLAGRLSIAREFGATLALVKGRVHTSGPILRRAGFDSYGQERCYAVDV